MDEVTAARAQFKKLIEMGWSPDNAAGLIADQSRPKGELQMPKTPAVPDRGGYKPITTPSAAAGIGNPAAPGAVTLMNGEVVPRKQAEDAGYAPGPDGKWFYQPNNPDAAPMPMTRPETESWGGVMSEGLQDMGAAAYESLRHPDDIAAGAPPTFPAFAGLGSPANADVLPEVGAAPFDPGFDNGDLANSIPRTPPTTKTEVVTPDRPPSTPSSATRSGGTVIGEPGEDGTGKSAGLFDGVMEGGIGALVKNWGELDEEKKNRIYEAMIAMGGAMLTTPGNFGEGLGAGFTAGLANYQDQEGFDAQSGIAKDENARRGRQADLDYSAKIMEMELLREQINDPSRSEAQRLEGLNRLRRLQHESAQMDKGIYSSGSPAKPTDVQEYLDIVAQLMASGMGEAEAMAKADAIFLGANARTGNSAFPEDTRPGLGSLAQG